MGSPKAALEWHGSTLLWRTVAIIGRAADGPVVVVRAPGQELPALPPGTEVVDDPLEGKGPVQGIAAGLAALADLGAVPSGQAARTLGLDPSTVTRLADRMVAAGHVTRGTDPRHRGVVTLGLTVSGRGLVAAAGAWRRRELARIMARLTPAEQAAATTALSLLVRAAGDDYGVTEHRPVPR